MCLNNNYLHNFNSLLVLFFVVSCLHVCIQAAKVDNTSFYIFLYNIIGTYIMNNYVEYLKKRKMLVFAFYFI